MKKPIISVVIPAFNEEAYLPRCLASLQKQTLQNFEIIVVDNNSTDKTAEIARSFGARVVKEKIQGMIPARERGFSEAGTPYIARTDADCVVPPNWLSLIYEAFERHPNSPAICGSVWFPNAHPLTRIFYSLINYLYIPLTTLLLGHYPLIGSNMAIRKSEWEKITVHTNDAQVHEDIDLACHLYKHGTIIFSPQIQASYSLRRWKRAFWPTLWEYTTRNIRTVLLHPHTRLSRVYTKLRLGNT